MKRIMPIVIILSIITSVIFSACNALEGYGRTKITWFVGFGASAVPESIKIQKQVVDEFNESQDKIWLVLEIAQTNSVAVQTLKEKIASGNSPDIVGPIGWGGSNAFYGQWLDMAQYIEESKYDTSVFNPNLIKFYQTEEGQVGLPFAVYPAMVFYNKGMFDRAGLTHPPAQYGEKYKLPDGTEVEWSWDTLTHVARLLTLDKNGKNATEAGFDRENIIQYGYHPQFQNPISLGTFWGADRLYEERDGRYIVRIPEQWAAAWKWYFDGMWGPEPFIPVGKVAYDANKSNGNVFGYGTSAMAVTQLWYSGCCIPLPADSWDMAVLPSYQGVVHGRVDADTFRILKSSRSPGAAFEVVEYLLGPAAKKLLASYGGMPARADAQEAFFNAQKNKFPWVKNWDVVQAGLSYPDRPSAEAYLPNESEAWPRIQLFTHLLFEDNSIDVDAEVEKFKADLQIIFDKK
jgi:multiple sugar transport system substrate-binding protein